MAGEYQSRCYMTVYLKPFIPLSGMKYTVIKTYKASKDDELTVNIGSVVEVLQTSDNGWWLVRYFILRSLRMIQCDGKISERVSDLHTHITFWGKLLKLSRQVFFLYSCDACVKLEIIRRHSAWIKIRNKGASTGLQPHTHSYLFFSLQSRW